MTVAHKSDDDEGEKRDEPRAKQDATAVLGQKRHAVTSFCREDGER